MAQTRVERRLAAILAVDVVGYSRLMARDEDGTFARLKGLRTEVVEPSITRWGGRIVDIKGDGSMIEFRSAVAAVEAAVDIQRLVREREADRPAAERLRFRMGINLGEVIVDGDAIYGDGVNVAARVESLCEPDEVWLTSAVQKEVEGKLDLVLATAGSHRMKNLGGAVAVFRVAASGPGATAPVIRRLHRMARPSRFLVAGAVAALALLLALWWGWGRGPGSHKPTVAVLPFANLSGDTVTGRLANGITADIVVDLARFRDLEVIGGAAVALVGAVAPGSAHRDERPNVDYVLEGSIQREDDRVRVSAQLLDSRDGTNVWTERWDRLAGDVFAVQAELGEQVASHVGGYGRIAEADRAAARRKPPGSLSAYDLYMLGVEAKHRMTAEGWTDAADLLQRAIVEDPGLARAWTALSWVQSMRAVAGEQNGAQSRREALVSARRALQLDPADAEAHAALGVALGALGDPAGAEPAFDEALLLNPHHPGVLAPFAAWASTFGRAEEGATAADRLVRLDPTYPVWAAGSIGYAYLMVGRLKDALEALGRIPPELRSRDQWVGVAVALAGLGRPAEAEVAAALDRFPDISAEALVSRATFPEDMIERATEAITMAGFPGCADPVDLSRLEVRHRLATCEAWRAKLPAPTRPDRRSID
jgi:class 3 adenylate cyclase/TolB-like protein